MLNVIFVAVVLASIVLAAYTGRMEALTSAVLTDAKKAVELAIGLVGVMAFFLGLMRVAQDGGIMRAVSRAIGPALRKLFPGVPAGHPAMDAMILNITSNMLGLANAATPFGIKAMEELNALNKEKGTATNAMALFLAINTAGLAILPSGVISLRASLGSQDASGIFVTTWAASGAATIVGVTAALLLSKLPLYRGTAPAVYGAGDETVPTAATDSGGEDLVAAAPTEESRRRRPKWGPAVIVGFWLLFFAALARYLWATVQAGELYPVMREVFSFWILPALIASLVLFGWARGVRVYESLVEGAKEGFQVALRIIPYLVAILVMVGMFRAAGWIDLLTAWVGPLTTAVGMPAEALPMAILRPLTGSGAYGIAAEIMTAHGPDSLIGYMVSTFQGSTETTFYVLAVYFGAVGVKRTRHTLPACLCADVAGISMAVFIVNLIYG